jgi:hypothetical protein
MRSDAITAGEIIVTRSPTEPTRLYFPMTSNKILRVAPGLIVGLICLYKSAVLIKGIILRQYLHPTPEGVLGLLAMVVVFVLLGRIMMFLVYLLFPRQLILDTARGVGELRYSGFLRRRLDLRAIRAVELATYDFHGKWLGFCCLSMGSDRPRLYLTSTIQGMQRSDQALTAGRELAEVLMQELNAPMKRYENVTLRWFHGASR